MRLVPLWPMNKASVRSLLKKVDEFLPPPEPSVLSSLSIAAGSVAVAAVLREVLGSLANEAQFLTFFPAVVVSTLFGGTRSGAAAIALSAAAWWLFHGSSAAGPMEGHFIALGLFIVLSGLLVAAVDAIRTSLAEARSLHQSLERRVDVRTEELEASRQDLKRLSAELEYLVDRRTEELEESKNLLGAVIDELPDAVILFKVHGEDIRFAYINTAAEGFIGHQRQSIIGKTDVELIEPKFALENRQALALNTPLRITERRLQTATGTRCVEVRKFPFKNFIGPDSALLVIIRDITELRELEKSLRHSHRMDALGQLTGGIAHDFNNLLAIAIGNLDLLEDRDISPAEAKELLEDARNACLRGGELTGRLLAFARKQTLNSVSTDINQRLAEFTRLLSRLLSSDIDLRLKLSPKLWNAVVDPGQLEAALTNLATNARDAMPKGGRLTITTRNEVLDTSYTSKHPELRPGEYVAIEVSDNGSGMTPDIQEKAVEPFFTTKEEGNGTGLGLSMVFGFAKQTGGHVHLYSEPGEGTTAVLFLPRAESTSADRTPKNTGLAECARGETILVVDDNASLRKVAVKQLSSLGYKVFEAADGPSALQLLRDEAAVDLLLTDIFMPGGLSGVELGREARQLRPELQLIYMSGFPETASGDRADLDPGVVLLRKPFRKIELSKRLREVLDRGKSGGREVASGGVMSRRQTRDVS